MGEANRLLLSCSLVFDRRAGARAGHFSAPVLPPCHKGRGGQPPPLPPWFRRPWTHLQSAVHSGLILQTLLQQQLQHNVNKIKLKFVVNKSIYIQNENFKVYMNCKVIIWSQVTICNNLTVSNWLLTVCLRLTVNTKLDIRITGYPESVPDIRIRYRIRQFFTPTIRIRIR
jgi:hypothetical protein